jgi:hypothetical protein
MKTSKALVVVSTLLATVAGTGALGIGRRSKVFWGNSHPGGDER